MRAISLKDVETFALMSSGVSAHPERIREGWKARVWEGLGPCTMPWWELWPLPWPPATPPNMGMWQGNRRKIPVIGILLTTTSPNVLISYF